MYRAGLLAVLLLAVAVLAGNVTLTCTVESSYTVDTTDSIDVSFKFESIAPVFPGWVILTHLNLIFMYADSAQWDRPLKFNVTLEHYAPNQPWVVNVYRCVYNNSGNVEVRYYHVVAQTPERRTTTITFTVPDTATRYSNSTSVKVSKPLEGTYCSAPPNATSWPNCPAFKAEDNKVSVEYPKSWRALQVNGRRPGETVRAYGVNATIPDPWEYGIDSNVGTLSFVQIDGDVFKKYKPSDAKDIPVSSSVYFYAVGMPKQWGEVKARGAQAPLYVAKRIVSQQPPTTFCKPPACVVLAWANFTHLCPNATGSKYVAIVAVKSGTILEEHVEYHIGTHIHSWTTVYLPLGSVFELAVRTLWFGWVAIELAEPPHPRVIHYPTYYERIAEKGKINAPFGTFGKDSLIAVAVDESAQSIELGWYSRPIPFYDFPTEEITWIANVYLCNYMTKGISLSASIWTTEGLKRNHPDISRGRYLDLLHYLYGESTVYYWGDGDQYGMVSVHTARRYTGTTADAAGLVKLNHTTGIKPTDVGVLDIWSAPQTIGEGGDDRVSPWLIAPVPTIACRTMFCTSLSPELLGPLPPFPGDRALPNMGYSIMLMYIGNSSRHRVKVYVEDGYVITSRQSINITRVRNYKLVEIDKEWRPFEAVIVGPGWWVSYRRLGPCETMPIRTSSIYATPDRLSPVKIIVEDNGRNFTYVFYVTNDVKYRIITYTPAPESITATPFNIATRILLGGVPYYHAVYGYGEGGRLSPPACASMRFNNFLTPQLMFSGDFWGSFGLANMPLKPVNIEYIYTKPRFELANPWRGLVRVRADGPVAGFAFYAQRGGTWVKIGEAGGRCVLINASRIFPWDPILVLPLVEQELTARPGDTVTIWRPETALLFKTWADVVGYPKGARSELKIVGTC